MGNHFQSLRIKSIEETRLKCYRRTDIKAMWEYSPCILRFVGEEYKIYTRQKGVGSDTFKMSLYAYVFLAFVSLKISH